MRLLAFDTSTDVMSIAVAGGLGGQDVPCATTAPGGALASTTLLPAIIALMRQAGLGFLQLDAIVFGRGPGAFTGLRTACSVAQGLGFGALGLAGGRELQVLPVDTLLTLAEVARHQLGAGAGFRAFALLDARMNEVYNAAFEFDGSRWQQQQEHRLDAPQHLLPPPPWVGAPYVTVGNVFESMGSQLGPAAGLQQVWAVPQAQAMLRLAPVLLAAGLAVAPEHALPTYIRDKVAQTTHERTAAKAQTARQGGPHHPPA